jgi:hypothetical protein
MAVVEVVQQRLQTGDISAVVTGSSSGASAMLLVDSGLPTGCRVMNVSAPADAFERFGWRPMTAEAKAELARRGITLLEQAADWRAAARALCHCSNTAETVRCARPDLLFYETLIDVGGMGLKTAVECVLDACLQRAVEVGERVIGVAGTGRGFDTAAVIRATIPACVFGQDPSERPEVEEILATPRPKQRYY